ncbi:Armadillo-type fold [Phytophthora cactorum]|nr:Armadillo-type fold [Phytophthora cactorum]
MSFGGKTNAVLELGKRLIQPEEEWKDKCGLHGATRPPVGLVFAAEQLKDAPEAAAAEDAVTLFTPENVQALTQPFRVTVTDLRSTVVKEACTTLSLLAQTLGPVRCKILVRDVFPTLLDARGGSNKTIVGATPSRFVLAPVLQVLDTSKNREVRESCIHYTYLALEGWNSAILERFKIPLQSAIATSLSDASPKGREQAAIATGNISQSGPMKLKATEPAANVSSKDRHKDACFRRPEDNPSNLRHESTGNTGTIASERCSNPREWRLSAKPNSFDPDVCIEETTGRQYTVKPPPPTNERGVTELESELSSLSEQLESAKAKLEASNTEAGDEMNALRSEKCALEERLSTQRVQLEELQAKQCAAVAAFEEEKRVLTSELSALKSGQIREGEVGGVHTEAGDEMNALRSEKCALEERLSTQRVQLEELQAKQCAAVAAFEEEKRVLTSELSALKSGQSDAMARCNEKDELCVGGAFVDQRVQLEELQAKQCAAVAAFEEEKRVLTSELSALKSGQSDAMARCNEKDERVAQLESELSSLSEQLESAKAKLEASTTEAGDEMNALRSEKCALEERLSTQRVQLEELQAKQCAAVAAFEEEKRVLTSELSALKSGQSDAMARCNEKDERVAQLESELSSLSEQLESAKAKLEASNTEAGDEMNALRSEKCALEERLSTQRVQLEELQAKQCAAVAAFEEEKRVLTSELSALKSGQSDAMARCNEKDERVAQLESELSSLSEQLESAKAKLEASTTEAGDEMNALRSEKCALEERLSTQRVQLEELQAKQCAAVAAFEEEKRVLTSELSALKSGQSDVMNNGIAKDTSVKVIGVGLERSAAGQSDVHGESGKTDDGIGI